MRFIRSPAKCVKIFAISCLATFIGLQVLGSMSFFLSSNNQTSISSNVRDNKYSNEKGKGENVARHVNLKNLKQQNNKLTIQTDKDKRIDKQRHNGLVNPGHVAEKSSPARLKEESVDVAASYKEHSETLLADESRAQPYKSTLQPPDPVQQTIRVEADDSLAGQRIHGLPNITGSSGSRSKNNGKDTEKPIKDLKKEIAHILKRIESINNEQSVKNEDIFGPVDNNGTLAIIVVQVHNRLQYLRQLIISFSQAKDIDRTLIIFSHDFWDDQLNELVESIDFAKILQIFYPYSIQTHTDIFPGESANDCPRNAKKEQANRLGCINAKWPDLYGHYREAKFSQTKHHWWWKANRIFNELRVTKNYNGLVLFLEEDHFVAEDFLSVLSLMKQERDLRYPTCDILCLGTYLKQTNYKDDHKKIAAGFPGFIAGPGFRGRPVPIRRMLSYEENNFSIKETSTKFDLTSKSAILLPFKASHKTFSSFPSSFDTSKTQSTAVNNNLTTYSVSKMSKATLPNNKSINTLLQKHPRQQRSLLWSPPQIISSVLKVFRKDFQLWPGGPNFAQHQRVELTQWLSSKHNMGMAFTRDVWQKIHSCSTVFCQFDDYNWDWSLFHVSMTCLKAKLSVMIIKGPRVFHIGECGVHHKKSQCETDKVVKKFEQILEKANPFLFPKSLVVTSVQPKKTVKLPKGNGGWGDKRDQLMCLNMSTFNSTLLHDHLGDSFGL